MENSGLVEANYLEINEEIPFSKRGVHVSAVGPKYGDADPHTNACVRPSSRARLSAQLR
jgi:hypothetical protein